VVRLKSSVAPRILTLPDSLIADSGHRFNPLRCAEENSDIGGIIILLSQIQTWSEVDHLHLCSKLNDCEKSCTCLCELTPTIVSSLFTNITTRAR